MEINSGRIPGIWLFVASIGLLTVMSGCTSSPEDKAVSLFEKSIRHANNYEFEAARSGFAELSELEPKSPAGYFGSGLIFERQLQFYDALHVYMDIAQSHPSYAPAQAGCWRMFTRLELFEEAMDAALAYNDILPDDPESKLLAAEAFLNLDLTGRALSYLDSAKSLGSDPRLVDIMRARTYAAAHQEDSARLTYQKVGELSESSPQVTVEASAFWEKMGRIDTAIALSRAAVEQSEGAPVSLVSHFFLSLRHNYFYEARQVMEQFRQRKLPELVEAMLRLHYHHERGDDTPARHAVTDVEVLAGNTMTFWILDMVARAPSGDDLTLSNNADAIEVELVKRGYNEEFATYMFYFATMTLTEYLDEAIGYSKLERLAPKFVRRAPGMLRTAFVAYRTGRQEKFDEYESLIKTGHSRQPEWVAGLADIYANQFVRRYDDAREYYDRALELDQWYRPAFENYIEMLRRLGESSEVVSLFDEYGYFADWYPELRLLKAVCLAEDGQPERGLELYVTNAPYLHGDLTWSEELYRVLEDREYRPQISEQASWLLAHNSANPDAMILAGKMFFELKDFQNAERAISFALDLEPDNFTARALNAWLLYTRGEIQAALDILNENVAQKNYHIESNYYLSRILAMEGLEPHRAENLARKAVFDSNSNLRTWMNLSYVYFLTGRYDLSRGEALKASRGYPEEPEPLFRVGMAMYMEGKEEASEKLEEAIRLGLQGDNLAEAEATLKKL